MDNSTIVSIKNVSKEFPGVKALTDVSFDVYPGSVHVLIGENGAGKSTLIKMISGIYSIDKGTIFYNGKEIKFNSPREAIDNGISVIHQELSIVPDLSVAENIFLGREKRKGAFIDKKNLNDEAKKLLNELGVNIDPRTIAAELSTAEMQMVEIVRAISRNASLIIMDEPTSSISEHDVSVLFKAINKLKSNGVGIVYISHRMKELFEIGDIVTVLRDGQHIRTAPIKDLNTDMLISLMVGREIKNYFNKEKHAGQQVVLEVNNLSYGNEYKDISFKLCKGEILGIAGLIGAGRTELLRGIFGAEKTDQGEVIYKGKKVVFSSPKHAISNGIGLVPEDRKLQGVFVDFMIKDNISLPSLKKTSKGGFVNKRWERTVASEYIEKLRIKTPSMDTVIKNLSGGNQQKVVIAKWMVAESEVLLLDEVTRGIDVNAKAEIYSLINQYTSSGGSVLLVSSELPELLGICDRIMVMREGRLTGILNRSEATEESIMKLASISK